METESCQKYPFVLTISVHLYTIVLYEQLIQTGSVLLLLPFSTVVDFTLYKDIGDGKATTHQLQTCQESKSKIKSNQNSSSRSSSSGAAWAPGRAPPAVSA